MTENIRLLTARRRSRQKQGLQTFLAHFHVATGLPIVEGDIVDARSSILNERNLQHIILERLRNSSLRRRSELTWAEAQSSLDAYAARHVRDKFLVSLSHYPDFVFRAPVDTLANHAKSIIEFDGDTVYANSDDVRNGIGIDLYTSEIVHESRYTVDLWD